MLPATPDAALLLLTAGTALIAIELNRPGLILPGAAGLTAVLLAIATFAHQPLRPLSAAVACISLALLLAGFRKTLPATISATAGTALLAGLLTLLRPGAPVPLHAPVALACGLILALGLLILARIARRARRGKGLD